MRKFLFIFAAFAILCVPASMMAKSPRFNFSLNFDCSPYMYPQPIPVMLPPPQPMIVAVPCHPPRCYESETIIRERHDQFGSSYHKERRVYPYQRPHCPYCR